MINDNTNFGVSFVPGSGEPSQRGGGSGIEPVQKAIQLLSFRMPSFRGQRTPVGDPSLLKGSAAASTPRADVHSAVLASVLKTLLGGGQMGGNPSAASALTPPPPDVALSGGSPFAAAGRDPGVSTPTAPLTPRFQFSQGAPESDMRPHELPSPIDPGGRANEMPQPIDTGGRAHEIPLPPAPGGSFGDDMRAHEIPAKASLPTVAPPDQRGLIDEATRRVGAASDWNSFKGSSDPLVQQFINAFGLNADWNALRGGR